MKKEEKGKKRMKEMLNEKKENLKLKRRAKREELRERGITLIALVVTIIILLILAGVTLNIALSDGGLFSKTKKAAEDYKQAQTNEEGIITDIEKELDEYGSGNPSPSNPTPSEGTPTPIPIADAKSKSKFEKTETVEDGNGNKVVIPGEFKIASESGNTVQEGIVIEDDEGNQFVWIPVSNVNGGKDPDSSDGEDNLIKVDNDKTVEITLGRYTFATDSTGTPTLKQNGSKCKENNIDFLIDTFFKENTQENGDNAKAKDLKAFVDSVNKNHGYYIARYEASYKSGSSAEDYKPYTKTSTSSSASQVNKIQGILWNFITQEDASKASQNMYSGEDREANYVVSDLVNSYAWDTAIVYIQEMNEDNKNYANQNIGSGYSLRNTGDTGDEKCHIFDMGGNMAEWTTEYSTYNSGSSYGPCVCRGGCCFGDSSSYHTARRYYLPSDRYAYNGFRPLLYLK